MSRSCCICNRELPNRYAVAGTCEDDACEAVFCALHWRKSNHRCRQHGYEALQDTEPAEPQDDLEIEKDDTMNMDATPRQDAPQKSKPSSQVKKMMKDTLKLVSRMGSGASALLARLKKDKSPEAMILTIETSIGANKERRTLVSQQVEQTYTAIATKKAAFLKAPRAKQAIMEDELKTMLTEHNAHKKELQVLLENERVLTTVKGRLNEITAYDLRGVTDVLIDNIADVMEDKADDADAVLDATADLEKAGARRRKGADSEDLMEQLDGFDMEYEVSTTPSIVDALADFTMEAESESTHTKEASKED